MSREERKGMGEVSVSDTVTAMYEDEYNPDEDVIFFDKGTLTEEEIINLEGADE